MLGSSNKPVRVEPVRAPDAAKPAPPAPDTGNATKAVIATVTQALPARAGVRAGAAAGIWAAVTQSVRSLAVAEPADERLRAAGSRGTEDAAASEEAEARRASREAGDAAARARDADAAGRTPAGEAGDTGDVAQQQPVVAPAVSKPTLTPVSVPVPVRVGGTSKVSATAPIAEPVQRVAPAFIVRRGGTNPQASMARMIVWGVALAGVVLVICLLVDHVMPPVDNGDDGRDGASSACSRNSSNCARPTP